MGSADLPVRMNGICRPTCKDEWDRKGKSLGTRSLRVELVLCRDNSNPGEKNYKVKNVCKKIYKYQPCHSMLGESFEILSTFIESINLLV